MAYGLIAIIDKSSGWDGHGVDGPGTAAALAHQLRYHVQASYRATSAPVIYYGPHDGLVPAGAWPIYILDDPDVAGALGYHDVDPQGRPYGRVFVKPSEDNGISVSSVLSHEVIEAFVDPWANLWADGVHGSSIAFEACDPVESSSYKINGVEVSNFVTRDWFDPQSSSGRYDWLKHLAAPMTLEAGGYEIVMRDGAVSQKFADDYPAWRLALKQAPQPSRTLWRTVRVDFA